MGPKQYLLSLEEANIFTYYHYPNPTFDPVTISSLTL